MISAGNKTRERPPIVVVMGHVDHGKTTLLDTVRKLKAEPDSRIRATTEQETGGITQHIGAYEIQHKGKHITFIDTPGHEAFSAMRLRGTAVADVALLVIAADDSIKPQTKEAFEHIRAAELPFIVVINKIDKQNADPERVKNELLSIGIQVEDRGGKVPSVAISALREEGIDDLLDMIALVSELEAFVYSPVAPAEGYVLESFRDPRRGVATSLIVTNGTLRVGDVLVCGATYGKIKIMENFEGERIKGAMPSLPVRVIGVSDLASAGDPCRVVESETEAESMAGEYKTGIEKRLAELKIEPAGQERVFSIVLKADTAGSLEALIDSLRQIKSERVGLHVVKSDVGDVSESDIKFAGAAGASIIAFRVGAAKEAQQYAGQKSVAIARFDIIYELIEHVREEMSRFLEPEIVKEEIGRMSILAVFRTEPSRMIVGGRVVAGQIAKGSQVEVLRENSVAGTGRVSQIKVGTEIRDEVAKGNEAGVMFEGKTRITEGDTLIFYKEEKIYPELS